MFSYRSFHVIDFKELNLLRIPCKRVTKPCDVNLICIEIKSSAS